MVGFNIRGSNLQPNPINVRSERTKWNVSAFLKKIIGTLKLTPKILTAGTASNTAVL
jgi:hypothetical protein